MKIGIDKIAFYIPSYYLDVRELARARNVDENKYIIGLGQEKIAIVEDDQDCVSLAANAANLILNEKDKKEIDLILFATESSTDESKSGILYVHDLLELNPKARVVELKQACYSSTAALEFAKNYIKVNPNKKVLILSSDIAKYGLNSAGEPTQGAGAVAMIISKDPKVMFFEDVTTYYSQNINDFYRPVDCKYPIVDGKLSTDTYIDFFKVVYNDFIKETGFEIKDFAAICTHMPFCKLGQKALKTVTDDERIFSRYEVSKFYNKQVGNIYTGSLFLSLLSLIENDDTLNKGDRIGLFAYGSGAVGEFFSGVLVDGYKENLNKRVHHNLVEDRQALTIDEYEASYDGECINKYKKEHSIYVSEIKNKTRYYKKR